MSEPTRVPNPIFPSALLSVDLKVGEHYVVRDAYCSIKFGFTVVSKKPDLYFEAKLDGETKISYLYYEDLGLQVNQVDASWAEDFYVTKN